MNCNMMHLEVDSRNIFEYKLHSDAHFNSRAVHLFGALGSFRGDFSNRSCVCPGDLQITEQMVDISQARTIFSQNYDPVSTKQKCFCTVICEARPPTRYSCAFRREIWTEPFGGIEDLSTADVKLLFEKWSEGKNFEDLVTFLFRKTEGGRESKQTEELFPPHVISVSRHLSLWRGANAKWLQIRPEVMGTFSNGNRSRSMSHTHTQMLWNRSKHTQPLSHKSISSTEAGEQKRLASIRAPRLDWRFN